jgi:biopolymer transport protein ExbB
MMGLMQHTYSVMSTRLERIVIASSIFVSTAMPSAGLTQTLVAGDQSASGLLPRDLSPWSMFLNADIVVKVVMIGLAVASVATWTVLLAKSRELASAMKQQRRVLDIVDQARTLGQAAKELGEGAAASPLMAAAEAELRLSVQVLDDRDGVKERIVSRLERLEAAAGRRMVKGTGVLATIGATAPFVGLFGTVWGIMNSFIGISKAQTTNLAVVAPGIAQALLATALGLVAAIPAVVIYNHFARQTAIYKGLVADTSAAMMRLVSRDLSTRGRNTGAEWRSAAE